jgi:hypothetical protein
MYARYTRHHHGTYTRYITTVNPRPATELEGSADRILLNARDEDRPRWIEDMMTDPVIVTPSASGIVSARGALMGAEIAEQPEALARLLDHGSTEIAAVAAQVAARRPRFVLLAARGTSDHAALYGKYLVEVTVELPAG